MKNFKINKNTFMEWFEETFNTDTFSKEMVSNILQYANANIEIDKLAEFVSSLVPDLSREEIAKFISFDLDSAKLVSSGSLLPLGWKWCHNEDGSGCLQSPTGKRYFSYDCEPYRNTGAVEYQIKPPTGPWSVHWDGIKSFVAYAEEDISRIIQGDMFRNIMEDYKKHDVEFSSGFMQVPCELSLRRAVSLYCALQTSTNGDYIRLIKKPVIDMDARIIFSGKICEFDEVLPQTLFVENGTLEEVLIAAEESVKKTGEYLLVRLDDYEADVKGNILSGKVLDFVF